MIRIILLYCSKHVTYAGSKIHIVDIYI